MKRIILLFTLICGFNCLAQKEEKISTLDFVEILNGNHAEAAFYYENNWKKLREIALDKGYIYSFQMLKTEATEDYPISFILITTYTNHPEFELREKHFSEVMKIKGDLELLNDKKPAEFRKTLFSKEKSIHLE
ncbi:hypothetical protein ML462_02745 [Gramella lutea]|uniref:Uncharacterized protein n=1 Tax=Christiangramia lutea TaxID=1607951 RepID=A0A9X1V0S5_9FLAO|nr:hypothetical protein [Christiangramia lutea]MCH4822078.1 hypothetical protein [Christiangramia lutea]